MNSWLAWIVTAAVAVTLGAVGYHFSLRTLRWVALIIALATAAYLTGYGLTHPGQKPGSLSDEFARSADTLSTALIRPFSLGHAVPVPGRIGWLAIVVLLVLVAVRQARLAGVEDLSRLHHAKTIARITAAISGDTKDFVEVWPKFPPKTVKNQQPVPARLRTRLRPGQCSTPSWPAAYNLACAYAALAEKADAKYQPHLIEKVVGSLEFTVSNPECEMERPSEWIGNDPDFSRLSGGRNDRFMEFLDDQWKRDYPVGG